MSTCAQQPIKMGKLGVANMAKIFAGKDAESYIDTGCELITSENAKQSGGQDMNYKKLIVDSGKRMAGSGLTVETWGNISVRDSETGLVYLTPSAMLYDTIVEDDVVVCTLDGKIVEGTRKPTIETEMHLSVYRNRAEVNAVIHTHPLYSMVYAAQGKDIPLIIDEAAQIMGDVCRCTEYALPGSQELADNCVKALGEKANSCLIHSHGAVCVG